MSSAEKKTAATRMRVMLFGRSDAKSKSDAADALLTFRESGFLTRFDVCCVTSFCFRGLHTHRSLLVRRPRET